MAGPESERDAEARRILKRLENEQQSDGGLLSRTASRVEKHLSGADADPSDKIEVWGTRIGRAIAFLALAAAIAYLIIYLAQ